MATLGKNPFPCPFHLPEATAFLGLSPIFKVALLHVSNLSSKVTCPYHTWEKLSTFKDRVIKLGPL